MSGHVKVSGAWKTAAGLYVKVGGVWKTVSAAYTKVGGVWKQWFTSSNAAMELISTSYPTAGTTSVTFSSIPQTYKHLQIRMTVRSSNQTSQDYVYLQFNNDTGGNYASHSLYTSDGAGVYSNNQTGQSQIRLWASGGTYTYTNIFQPSIVDILDFTSTAKNKTIRMISGLHYPGMTTNVSLASGLWTSTAAVNTLTLRILNTTYSFQNGTRISLYGIKG